MVFTLAWIAVNSQQNRPSGKPTEDSSQQNVAQETLRDPFGWQPITWFTLFLVLVGAGQGALFFWQLGYLRSADETARRAADASAIAANAAKVAADAALAALDRPWLVLESLEQNSRTWPGKGRVNILSSLKIANYGKAPAFILSIKMRTFLSPPSVTPFDDSEWPERIVVKFPTSQQFGRFVYETAEAPFRMVDSIFFEGQEAHERVLFNTPLVVPSNDVSEQFFAKDFFHHNPVIATAIPIESLCAIYLVGSIVYAGPNPSAEMITFCFRGTRFGSFEAVGGAPYNQGHQSQWRGMPY